MVIQEYGLYIIITCLLQVVLMDTTIILLTIMVAMVLLLELVQVVEVQEIVILAEESAKLKTAFSVACSTSSCSISNRTIYFLLI